jgi:glycosyltransferase involved in cell wall biosynthesis
MMKILYHITNLPPKMAGTEASLQEIEALRDHFGGNLVHVNPNENSRLYWPRLLFGFHKLHSIRAAEGHIQAHHFYNADPFPFPMLRWLRRPVIYSISSGVRKNRPNIKFFSRLPAVIASDEVSFNRLARWGLSNVHLVRPGIRIDHFSYTPAPPPNFTLMMASAPWTRAQFKGKGIDELLSAVEQNPQLRLILLWRGILADEIKRRVNRRGLADRVEIINQKVEVNAILQRVHANIALASHESIVRAYPHSLIESLAAGKPVITSRAVPMSQFIETTGCGQVIETISTAAILEAIEQLIQNYTARQQAAWLAGQQHFSQQTVIEQFSQIYRDVIDATA